MTDRFGLSGCTSSSPLVLLADDDDNFRTLLVDVLRDLGMTVVVAGDGAEAIRLVLEHQAMLSCAILDLYMPVLDGLGAVRAIRQVAPGLPIVMMSSDFPHDFRQQVEALRIAHMLDKPFPLNELRSVVHDISAAPPEAHNGAEL